MVLHFATRLMQARSAGGVFLGDILQARWCIGRHEKVRCRSHEDVMGQAGAGAFGARRGTATR